MSPRTRTMTAPRPFLKWVGGKRQLLEELLAGVDAAGSFHRYHEPFVGGGALFFELVRTKRLSRAHAYLSDNNRPLTDTYRALKDDVDAVIALLQKHKQRHDADYYYSVRADVPEGRFARAARIVYLNKTCYNGLYRENSKGLFNVPVGRYKNPRICDEPNLRAVAEALRRAKIETRPFHSVLDHAKPGDLVYFDPPYHPVSKTASFTGYDRYGFDETAQRELAEVFTELKRRGVKALLSNSMTPLIEKLYRKRHQVEEVFARRSVNSKAGLRGKVSEALVRNF